MSDASSPGSPDTGSPNPRSGDDAEVADVAMPPPDAGGAGMTGQDSSLETVDVPGTGAPAMSQTMLTAGATYLLKATGSLTSSGQTIDAEFAGMMDMVGTSDVGIDVGILQPHPLEHNVTVPDGPGRIKWFGAYQTNHVYYMWVTGAGKALTMKLVGGAAGASGSIAVEIFALGAAPPAMWTPNNGMAPSPPPAPKIGHDAIDTVQVPVAKMMVSSKALPTAGAVYLLEASSAGIVGGGGLHMGDAEYMDWDATGMGHNDGEGGADFGISVDEPVAMGPPATVSKYNHRKSWWGLYRNDHIYYQLYVGTGKPISFLYFDSGYGDNSPTDTLTVRVFPTP
jgi:hypothetical protein